MYSEAAMQSDFAQPPAPKLLADTPTNLRLFATEEVEKDSMDHRYVLLLPREGSQVYM